MARKFLINSTTNLATAADWGSETNIPTLHATTDILNFGASGVPKYTAVFTAPNTTNAVLGVWVYLTGSNVTGTTITATLYENNVATACTVTVTCPITQNFVWCYFKFPTPYVFTSTTAGYYKFGFTSSSNAVDGAADAAGTGVAFICVDDRTGAPAATDDLWIGGDMASPTVLTLSGTQGFGSNTKTTYSNNGRALDWALNVATGGKVVYDNTTTSAITLKGWGWVGYYGEMSIGTVANKIAAGQTVNTIFSMNASNQAGIIVQNYGTFTVQGQPLTYWKTLYASGVGTAADPLILADAVDWSVGDKIIISASSDDADNYLQNETRYIITKNSSTSYVVSSTLGGSENALAYTHSTDARVFSMSRNVKFTTNSPNTYFGIITLNSQTDQGFVDIDNFVSESLGGSNNVGVYILNNCAADNFVCDDWVRYPASFQSIVPMTYSNVLCVGKTAEDSTASGLQLASRACIFNDFYVLNGGYDAVYLAASYACIFNRLVLIGVGFNVASSVGIRMASSIDITFNDCEIHCSRGNSPGAYGALHTNNSIGLIFNDCLFGTKGKNYLVLAIQGSTYNTIVFNNCNFGVNSSVVGTTYVDMVPGSYINLAPLTYGGDDNYSYRSEGILQTAGTGLTYTTVHTAGGYSLAFKPETSTIGLPWEFLVPTGSLLGVDVNISLWVYINNANFYAGTHQNPTLTVNYDNGTLATAVATDIAGSWQKLTASFTPTTSYGRLTIKVDGYTDATGTDALFFVDDFGGGYLVNSSLDLWADGLPVSPSYSFVVTGDMITDAVWEVATSTLTTTGTIGKAVVTANKIIGWLRSLL